VIAAQQRRSAEPIGEENREEVIVVAELQLLRAGVRRFRLERWRLLEKRVAPADDRGPAVIDWQNSASTPSGAGSIGSNSRPLGGGAGEL
jgi:hypothetical protein